MKTWKQFAGVAVAVTAVGAGASNASAELFLAGIQQKESVTPAGALDRAAAASNGHVLWSQGFVVTGASILDRLEILGNSPAGSDVTLMITDARDGGSAPNVFFEGTFAIDAGDIGDRMWHSFNLDGVELDSAGEYFLIIRSNTTSGFETRKVDAANGVGLTSHAGVLSQSPDTFYNDSWTTFNNTVLAIQFFGSEGGTGDPTVPTPGAIALFGLAGIAALRRRR